MDAIQPELYLSVGTTLGEGPFWHPSTGELYWVDIEEHRLQRYQPESQQEHTYDFDEPVGCAAPRRSGGLILALQNSIILFDPSTSKRQVLAEPEAHLPDNRFNDGKCDPAGRFLVGSMNMGEISASGSLYVIDSDYQVRVLISGVRISNGLGWSPDYHIFYYIDTPTRAVKAYDYDLERGEITNPRTVISVPEGMGYPDGMTVDQEGLLWIAMWGGAQFTRWDPSTGQLAASFRLPALNVTSCTFGGKELDELYITTARTGLDPSVIMRYPGSGHIYRFKAGVKGMPTFEFAG